MAKYDWRKIRNEYETLDTSYRKLVEKHGVSLTALKTRAKKESWVSRKEKTSHKIDAKTTQKTIEKISDKNSDRNSRHIKILDRFMDLVEKMLSEDQLNKAIDMFGNEFETKIISHQKVKSIMETFERAQKGHRVAEGLMTEYEKRKLALEEKKINVAADLPDVIFTDLPVSGSEDDDGEL